jgi:putative ABC transport system permease protein
MLVLLAVVLALLLIACANVANLVLVRSVGRLREFALRAALGCTTARMMRQLITENLALAAAGGVLGAIVAWGAVRALASALPPQIPHTASISVDGRVLTFAAVLTIMSGLAFGLLPAVRAAWARGTPGVSGDRSGAMSARHGRLAGALTVAQLALAVVLVAAAGLLLRSFDELRRVNPGFSAAPVLSASVTLSPANYHSDQRTVTFFDALIERLRTQPGVASVAAVNRPPLRGPVYGTALRVEGQFEDVKHTLPTIEHAQTVTPGYFETMGIAIVRGRDFASGDRAGMPDVAVVSASLAKRFWPNGDAIGKHIGAPYPGSWITIVGVVAEVQQDSLSGRAEMTLYRPLAQSPDNDMTLVVRTAGSTEAFAASLRATVATLDRATPVSDVRPMADIVAASLARTRFTAVLLLSFAALAVLLGAVGVYGVVAFGVAQRTREFGVRLALGATPGGLLRRVVARGATMAFAGVSLGLVASFVVTRALTGLLYGATATDAVTFTVAPALLLIVAIAATWIPARRAVLADPLRSLRPD